MEQELLAQLSSVAEGLKNISSQMGNRSAVSVGGIGGLFGIAAFLWNLWHAWQRYLHIDLSVNFREDGSLSALTIVENRNSLWMNKEIGSALLLVGPESEEPTDTFNCIFRHSDLKRSVKSTNDIVERAKQIADEYETSNIHSGPAGRLLILLPFYYSENIRISDERVSYRSPIDTTEIPSNTPYSVRFFIYVPGRLHRSTHDSFVLPGDRPGDMR